MKSPSVLSIRNLHVFIENTEILHGVSLDVRAGEVHALMGPNGSGKSTLASVLLGHTAYTVRISGTRTKSKILLNGKDMLALPTEKRAIAGLFLAFQSPVAIPGVTVMNVLRSAYEARFRETSAGSRSVQSPVLAGKFRVGSMSIGEFTAVVKSYAVKLHLAEDLLRRGIHDGFSGGEKKKIEMLQALVIPNKFAVFDEIDTGLDVDALRAVSTGIGLLRGQGTGVLIITHYQRILRYVKPDVVHVLVAGKLVDHGDAGLAKKIEQHGYGTYLR